MDNGKARRKSFLCWAPDVIFNEKDNSDRQNCIDVFPHERPVCGYTEQVVKRKLFSPCYFSPIISDRSFSRQNNHSQSHICYGRLRLFSVLVSKLRERKK